MNIKCHPRFDTSALFAGALLLAASLPTAQAASTFITFSVDMSNTAFTPGTDTVSVNGTFNGYGAAALVQDVSQMPEVVYTNTINDTTDANGNKVQYKFVMNGNNWENPSSSQNRCALLPSTSGASLVLPTAFFSDNGSPVANNVTFQVDMSQQINLGNFVPGTSTIEVHGKFSGWGDAMNLTLDDTILRTNQYGLVSSNVYTGTTVIVDSPGAAEVFKYVINGNNWENPSSVNLDGGGNRYFANEPQTLPVVFFSDLPYAPVVSNINFSVDMSIVALTDTNFNSATVMVWGDFNGWSGGLQMTNNPTAANTNIYTSPSGFSLGVGSTMNYQFRYHQLSDLNPNDWVYDHLNGANGGQGNRQYAVQNVASTNLLAVFNDASLSDYLLQPTPVLFSVDMNGAVGANVDTLPFNSASDNVYINGEFAGWYTWGSDNTHPAAPAGFQMVQMGNTTIYTNTIIVPAGTHPAFNYKYGIDHNAAVGGPADDEAGANTNHYRVVRSTALNPYMLPLDQFGNMYSEPYFNSGNTAGGNLTVGPKTAGNVPVQWLGRPGAQLQVKSSLTGGAWQTITATDGTNWTTGFSSTNGFVSQTNWPATGTQFFRLVKP